MSKLPISRIFDTAIIAKFRAYTELEPFVNWVQETIDTFFRTLNKQVTISDNLDAQLFTVRLRGTSSIVSANLALQKRPIAVLLGKQNPISPAVLTFVWQLAQNGQTQVTVTFSTPPTDGVEITVLAFYS